MPSIELTENLRQTIRDLRKKRKKRGDDLSRELGKGASYISQIENGKIKEIDFELLNEIFLKITDLTEIQYSEFMNNLLDNVSTHMTEEDLQHEKWIHQFNHEIRKFPIENSLKEYLTEKLEELNISPEELVAHINENHGLSEPEQSDIDFNKLNIQIIDHGNGNYNILSSIRFKLEDDFVRNILDGKTQTINYINMQGIIYNLFLYQGLSDNICQEKAKEELKRFGFFTLSERQRIMEDNANEISKSKPDFTLYDILPTDREKEIAQTIKAINNGFNYLRDANIKIANDRLGTLLKSMKEDLGFASAIMGLPYYKIPKDMKEDFLKQLQELFLKYLDDDKTDNENTFNIEK